MSLKEAQIIRPKIVHVFVTKLFVYCHCAFNVIIFCVIPSGKKLFADVVVSRSYSDRLWTLSVSFLMIATR